jgi:hypothetical protein
MRKTVWPLLFALILTSIMTANAMSQQPVQSKIRDIALFKNGLAVVVREVALPGAGEWVLEDMPIPSHGTFWLLSETNGLILGSAVSTLRLSEHHSPAASFPDLLQANKGRRLYIRFADSDKWLAIRIIGIPDDRQDASNSILFPNEQTYESWLPDRRKSEREPVPTARSIVLLEVDGQRMAVPISDVTGLREGEDALELTNVHQTPEVDLRINTTGTSGTLTIMYMVHGLTWAPSYQVDISEEDSARIRCKATVLNDVEDIKNAVLHLVTGFPHFSFSEVHDPLSLQLDVSRFLRELTAVTGDRRLSSSVQTQTVLTNVSSFESSESDNQAEITGGESTGDLYLSPLTGITLNRRERGYFPLFEKEVPCEQLYICQLPDITASPHETPRFMEIQDRSVEIWHALKLKNNSNWPWSTAPAMTTSSGRSLGQDTLPFTPVGGTAILRITQALGVVGLQKELELKRIRDESYSEYQIVTAHGEIQFINHKKHKIHLLVRKPLLGNLTQSRPTAKVTSLPRISGRVDPQQLLTWEINLDPNEKLVLSYDYTVRVRY